MKNDSSELVDSRRLMSHFIFKKIILCLEVHSPTQIPYPLRYFPDAHPNRFWARAEAYRQKCNPSFPCG